MSAPQARLERRARVDLGDYPADAAWSPDGRALIVAGGQGALLWLDIAAVTAGAKPERFGEHAGGTLALAWQAAGRLLASSGQDGEVRLWDTRTRESQLIHAAAEWSECIAFAGNGKLLAVATGRQLQAFDSGGALRAQAPPRTGVIAALAWRPKGSELATLGNGGAQVHRIDAQPQAQVQTRSYAAAGACLTASWSPDGRILATGMQDGAVQFWNIGANTESQMKGYGTKVALTSWSANGRYLATAADQQIIIWDFSGRGPEGTEPLQLGAHTARLTQLAFQPQGPLLAAGARDRRLSLWRPGLADTPQDADLLGDEIALLRWSHDGLQLAVGDRSGAMNLYALQRTTGR